MLQLKVGIQLASLRQPFRKAVDLAAQLGVNAIEIDARSELRPQDLSRTAVRQIQKLLADRNLEVAAVKFQTRRGYDNLEDLEPRLEATKQAMKMAFELGCSVVCNDLGMIPDEQLTGQRATLNEAMTDLGRFSQKNGVWLAATTAAKEPTALRALIDDLPLGSLAVDFDPAGIVLHRGSPTEFMESLAENVVHFRVRDAVQGLALGKGVEVQVGRGSVDFPALLAKLEEKQFRGYLTLSQGESDNPLGDAALAKEYLDNLWS